MTTATVLVVDDSRAIRAFIRRALEEAGLRAAEACDGLEALDRVREDPPDAILLDVDMPRLDGFATLEALKADRASAHIPVIFLTAHSAVEGAVTGFTLGARDYIRKPCSPEELIARLRAILALKAKHDALHLQVATLTHLSGTDALTELPNRRQLDDLIATLRTGPQTRHRPLSLALLDIDHFKRVNDREGHPAGDLALRAVAQAVAGVVPDGGCLGRWGGEEFLCVLPGLDLGEATRRAEMLRHAVSTESICLSDGRALRLTVSIGVATGVAAEAENILSGADAAVYEAKRAGRNRVVAAVHAEPFA